MISLSKSSSSSRRSYSQVSTSFNTVLHPSWITSLKTADMRFALIAVLIFVSCAHAWGLLAIDANLSTNSTSANNSVSTGAFSTASANELLLAYVATDWKSGSNTVVNSVSGGGLSWSLVKRTNVQSGTAEIWGAFATARLTNITVTASLSQSVYASITVMSYTGADPAAPTGAVGSGNGTSGAPSGNIVTTRNGSWVFGVGNDFDNAIARTPAAGQKVVNQYLAPVGDTYWVQMQNTPTTSSGTTVYINDTAPNGDRYNVSVVEVLPLQGYTISGAITPSSLGAGTVVTLTQNGTAVATATADATGAYAFPGVANGSYVLSATKTGCVFTPTTQNITMNGVNVTSNFTVSAIIGAYSISGTITGGAGSLITLSGNASASTNAASSGAYTFSGLSSGSYTVTPSHSGYTFSPASQNVTISASNATANFAAQSQTWSLSGNVTPALAGIAMTLSGASSASTTTNGSGSYSFGSLANGAYTVTPSLSGYAFSPTNRSVTVSGGNVSGANFTSTSTRTWSISGTVSPAAAGVTVALSGTSTGSATTDSSGNYSFAGLAKGSYTLTPSQSGYTFAPTTLAVTINRSNVSGENFTRQQTTSGSISIDATVTANSAVAQSSVSSPSLSTNATNELLLAFVASDSPSSPNTTVNSITGGGLTWTLVQRTNVQAGTAEIWRAFATTQLTGVSVTASLSQSAMASITVMSYSGVDGSKTDGSSAIGAVGSNNASSGAPSASIVTTRNNSWVFGVGVDFDSATMRTPAAGQSLVGQYLTINGDTFWTQMQQAATPSSGTTVYINDTAPTGDRFNLSVVEVLPGAAQGTWNIAGNISPSAIGAGATVTLSGASAASTVADSSGNYSFANLANGNYAITPSATGVSFSPTVTAVKVSGANTTGVNFTAAIAPPTYGLAGTISPANVGAGATVTISGPVSASTSVNASGYYSFGGLLAGTYTVTPTSSTATFSPTSQGVTITNASLTTVNFTATATSNIVFYDDFTGTSLSPDWTIISRHGEYAQNETECNTPGQVSVGNSLLTITTIAQNTVCGDFNPNGSVRTPPSTWPYATGDVQWSNFNFKYGTVTIRGRMPAFGTDLWPAFWLLGSNCQQTNPMTGDTGIGTCPNPGTNGYTEIDFPECYGGTANTWCQFHVANPSFGMGGGCDASYSLDTNYHIFTYDWTPSAITVSIDGTKVSTCNTAMTYGPMFLIMQIQTGGSGGTPNNSMLPASLAVDYVKVTQP